MFGLDRELPRLIRNLTRLDQFFNRSSNCFYSFSSQVTREPNELKSSNFNIETEISNLSRAIKAMLNFPKCSMCDFDQLQLYNYYF
jgi:hypothetical protein